MANVVVWYEVLRPFLRELDGGDAPKKTWLDCIKEDIISFGLSGEDAQDKDDWESKG